jgi:hypothetical protein
MQEQLEFTGFGFTRAEAFSNANKTLDELISQKKGYVVIDRSNFASDIIGYFTCKAVAKMEFVDLPKAAVEESEYGIKKNSPAFAQTTEPRIMNALSIAAGFAPPPKEDKESLQKMISEMKEQTLVLEAKLKTYSMANNKVDELIKQFLQRKTDYNVVDRRNLFFVNELSGEYTCRAIATLEPIKLPGPVVSTPTQQETAKPLKYNAPHLSAIFAQKESREDSQRWLDESKEKTKVLEEKLQECDPLVTIDVQLLDVLNKLSSDYVIEYHNPRVKMELLALIFWACIYISQSSFHGVMSSILFSILFFYLAMKLFYEWWRERGDGLSLKDCVTRWKSSPDADFDILIAKDQKRLNAAGTDGGLLKMLFNQRCYRIVRNDVKKQQ